MSEIVETWRWESFRRLSRSDRNLLANHRRWKLIRRGGWREIAWNGRAASRTGNGIAAALCRSAKLLQIVTIFYFCLSRNVSSKWKWPAECRGVVKSAKLHGTEAVQNDFTRWSCHFKYSAICIKSRFLASTRFSFEREQIFAAISSISF